ncbi:hypothetical protein [Pseudomonas sp. B21-053]|uniref:hypothetical protein n=1 Tax=Pseudomonas sp. B21-053 TaxID=2895493 RepID=UPI0022317D7D|nr:hypothetical protein [Pseudomonas sp. B21-053]UZE13822.1 hypothetical protein LOY68_09480 [Pseudomonas sp. B21-053]
MISTVSIIISINGKKEPAELNCNNKKISIAFKMASGSCKTYFDTDFFRCFGRVRQDNPEIKFLCKGSKINVHTSSMSSQMSLGLKAYELTMGQESTLDDVIYIFDYDESDLTNDPDEQRAFYMRWIESEKT